VLSIFAKLILKHLFSLLEYSGSRVCLISRGIAASSARLAAQNESKLFCKLYEKKQF